MKPCHSPSASKLLILFFALLASCGAAFAEEPGAASAEKSMALVDFATPDAGKQVQGAKGLPAGSSVTVDKTGIVVNFTAFQPGDADHPGVHIFPATDKFWDLSSCGHIEAKIINTGAAGLNIVMHISDEGEGFWTEKKLENLNIKPGETKIIKVIFGYQKGFKPGAPVKTAKITEVFIYLYHSSQPHSFRIEEIKAAGNAGETPAADTAAKP